MRTTLITLVLCLVFVVALIAGVEVSPGSGTVTNMAGTAVGTYTSTGSGIATYDGNGSYLASWFWNGSSYDEWHGEAWMVFDCVAANLDGCYVWHFVVWEQVAPPGWPPYKLSEGYMY